MHARNDICEGTSSFFPFPLPARVFLCNFQKSRRGRSSLPFHCTTILLRMMRTITILCIAELKMLIAKKIVIVKNVIFYIFKMIFPKLILKNIILHLLWIIQGYGIIYLNNCIPFYFADIGNLVKFSYLCILNRYIYCDLYRHLALLYIKEQGLCKVDNIYVSI